MIIVLDPGHGGGQPGAVGQMSKYGGPEGQVLEKDLTRDFADAARGYLEQLLGATVYLAREGDEEVSLYNRAKVAHDNNADALISIHFNSGSSTAKGAETYYAQTRTSDKSFAQDIQTAMVDWYGRVDRGVKSDTQSGPGELSVLRYFGGDSYPRALIEV